MKHELPKLVIPDTRNYAKEIADRLDGQDRVMEKLAGLAQETNVLLASLIKQQADQWSAIERLSREVAEQQPRE